MSYVVRYYRDQATCEAMLKNTGRVTMPGYRLGRDRFRSQDEAERLAAHINSQKPEFPALVTTSGDPYTVDKFISPEEALICSLNR